MALGAVLRNPDVRVAMALRLLDVEAAWQAFGERHHEIPDALWARWRALDTDILWERAAATGMRFVIPGDAEWPMALDDLGPMRPWGVWVRGRPLPAAEARPVGVVGARSCTSYGERTAGLLGHDLAAAGTVVVSGGAYGIDAASHRGALAAGGQTIAVLASGLDVAYPLAHSSLFDRILECGSLVGEAPPGASPTRQGFLFRNRLIAALAYGTVVVEARLRSGSLSTLAQARRLHRVAMAVPGPVDSAESAGTNELIRGGACLVTNAADVLDLVAPMRLRPVPEAPRGEWDALASEERAIYEALPGRGGATVDALLQRVQPPLAVPALLAGLAGLAQRGLVAEQLDGRWRRLRAPRGAAA